eukprot:UN00720
MNININNLYDEAEPKIQAPKRRNKKGKSVFYENYEPPQNSLPLQSKNSLQLQWLDIKQIDKVLCTDNNNNSIRRQHLSDNNHSQT